MCFISFKGLSIIACILISFFIVSCDESVTSGGEFDSIKDDMVMVDTMAEEKVNQIAEQEIDDTEQNSIDLDNDLVADDKDNCPLISNFMQEDFDADGIGDDCDVLPYCHIIHCEHPSLEGGFKDFDGDGLYNYEGDDALMPSGFDYFYLEWCLDYHFEEDFEIELTSPRGEKMTPICVYLFD